MLQNFVHLKDNHLRNIMNNIIYAERNYESSYKNIGSNFYAVPEGHFLIVNHDDIKKWIVKSIDGTDAKTIFNASVLSLYELFMFALEHEKNINKFFSKKIINGGGESIFDILKMDKEFTYIFIVLNNNENSLVCDPPFYNVPKCFLVGLYNDTKYVHIEKYIAPSNTFGVQKDEDIDYHTGLHTLSSFVDPTDENFYDSILLLDYRKYKGVLMINFNNGLNIEVIISPQYSEKYLLRGDEPNFMKAFIQSLKNNNDECFQKTFYSRIDEIKSCRRKLFQLSKYIYSRFIKRSNGISHNKLHGSLENFMQLLLKKYKIADDVIQDNIKDEILKKTTQEICQLMEDNDISYSYFMENNKSSCQSFSNE